MEAILVIGILHMGILMIKSNTTKIVLQLVILFFAFGCFENRVHAIDYSELEVYGYQLASPHELEIENSTSVSSDDRQHLDGRILRSSFEFNYGLSDRLELAAYFDYWMPVDNNLEYLGFRAHARTRFFHQDQLPVNLGAYLEVELPRNFRQTDVALEFQPIIEKDISRFTIDVDPQMEISHSATENGMVVDADDGTVLSNGTLSSKRWGTTWGIASSIAFNYSQFFRPHLDWIASFSSPYQSLVMPSADFQIIPGLKATAGLGFGLNANTERRIVALRLEYEKYF